MNIFLTPPPLYFLLVLVLMVSESTLKSVKIDTGVMVLIITAISLYAGYQIGIRKGYYIRVEEETREKEE
jgi:hypothetical protein